MYYVLVSNAIRFTPYGEVAIECGLATEDGAGLDHRHVTLHISVRDSGIGIDSDKIGLIFEAFTQADGSTTRKFGGVGLGLNISSKLVSMMGGRIWVESLPGTGSTFHFTCRLATVPAGKNRQTPEIERSLSVATSHNRAPLCVLVVEDDESNRWLFQEILRNAGYLVVTVSDGTTALQEIARRDFDLVLLDLQLPDMDGYEVTLRIREDAKAGPAGEGRHLPVVAMSGTVHKDNREGCLEAGMDDFLAKPFMADHLLLKIREYAGVASPEPGERKGAGRSAVRDVSILETEIFNEAEAMRRAAGNRDAMLKRIRTFLRKAPPGIGMLRRGLTPGENAIPHTVLAEQELQNLKEMAMQTGAIHFADELFGLLLDVRNKQDIKVHQVDRLENEFEHFEKEPGVRRLVDHIDL